jgi:Ger(x)C family germination protein
MKKAAFGILILWLLTGCWDQLPLRDIHLTDMLVLDLDKESGEVVLGDIVTILSNANQGGGNPRSQMTEIQQPSLTEAVAKGDRLDLGPLLLTNIRMYVLSERFAASDKVRQLNYLLHAPYASINAPVVILDGPVSEFLKIKRGKKPYTQVLNEFILSLADMGVTPITSMMHFIVSQESSLEDMAVPMVKPSNEGVDFSGFLLFRKGTSTGVKLDTEQAQMLMLLLGESKVRQKFSGDLGQNAQYMFSVKKGSSKIEVHPNADGLPKINVKVPLQVYAFELGKEAIVREAEYVNQKEKELNDHLNALALGTIKAMQKANSDVLGIGKEIKAYHPSIWKGLNWRQDYPQLSVEPRFDVQILNTEVLKRR